MAKIVMTRKNDIHTVSHFSHFHPKTSFSQIWIKISESYLGTSLFHNEGLLKYASQELPKICPFQLHIDTF